MSASPPRRPLTLVGGIALGVLAALIVAIVALRHFAPPSPTTPAQTVLAVTPTPPHHLSVYQTNQPGPDCDKGPARWLPDANMTVSCLETGGAAVLVTDTAGAPQPAFESFAPLGYTFPLTFHAALFLSGLHAVNAADQVAACGGLLARQQGARGYAFLVCADGQWRIARLAADGTMTDLPGASGTTAGNTSYDLAIALSPTTLQLMINNVTVATAQDSTYTDGGLAIMLLHGGTAMTLQNFVYSG